MGNGGRRKLERSLICLNVVGIRMNIPSYPTNFTRPRVVHAHCLVQSRKNIGRQKPIDATLGWLIWMAEVHTWSRVQFGPEGDELAQMPFTPKSIVRLKHLEVRGPIMLQYLLPLEPQRRTHQDLRIKSEGEQVHLPPFR